MPRVDVVGAGGELDVELRGLYVVLGLSDHDQTDIPFGQISGLIDYEATTADSTSDVRPRGS